jgi:hypothetical protein
MSELLELASVIHDARFGDDYPEHLRNGFQTECSSGQEYCKRLARAVISAGWLRSQGANARASRVNMSGTDLMPMDEVRKIADALRSPPGDRSVLRTWRLD